MIYDPVDISSPISQGDIFLNIPIVDFRSEELVFMDNEGGLDSLPWSTFAEQASGRDAFVAVRPTIGIVGTQDCDAYRAPIITFFEVRPFRDVERKSKETVKPAKWATLLTQHARINLKWFYLPEDRQVGFTEKMGVDFLTSIPVPRVAVEQMLAFRVGRLYYCVRALPGKIREFL